MGSDHAGGHATEDDEALHLCPGRNVREVAIIENARRKPTATSDRATGSCDVNRLLEHTERCIVVRLGRDLLHELDVFHCVGRVKNDNRPSGQPA
jgi:hypothetical protein